MEVERLSHCWQKILSKKFKPSWTPVKNWVLWWPELPPSASMAGERLSKMESSDDRSFLQVHLWHSTARKMTYPLFLCATFYMSGAVCSLILARISIIPNNFPLAGTTSSLKSARRTARSEATAAAARTTRTARAGATRTLTSCWCNKNLD